MTYYSLNRQAPDATFEQAVVKGLAPDKGLYFPASVTPFTNDFLNTLEDLSDHDIAIQTIKQFVLPDIPEKALEEIISDTLDFDFPIVKLNENISTLELFSWPYHGFQRCRSTIHGAMSWIL